MKRRLFLLLLTAVASCSGILIPLQASALSLATADWQAGRIMDDGVFADNDSMNAQDIQNFLNTEVGVNQTNSIPGQCDTNGTHPSEYGGGTRAQWGAAHGTPAPFTCLKDYYEVPKTTPGPGIPASNYGGRSIPPGAISAAQIIYNAAQQYQISPKVLLTVLQKESVGPLVTDAWPTASQYTYAMGSHCPDTASCDSNYAGFSMQMYSAAGLFRSYLDGMDQSWWGCTDGSGHKIQCPAEQQGGADAGGSYKVPFTTDFILYSPNRACGGANINIQSKATAALYMYTPYQPNAAALNNMYSTGDSCSSYGNRNFWTLYYGWFGSPLGIQYSWRQVDKELYTDSSMSIPLSEGNIKRGESFFGQIKALNTGTATWRKGVSGQQVNLGTSNPIDRSSSFCDIDWMSPVGCGRVATTLESTVAPGEIGTFDFWLTAPTQSGVYSEYFNLVADGTSWLQDVGFYWHFTVSNDFSTAGDAEPYSSLALGSKTELRRNERLVSPDGNTVLIFKPEGFLSILNNYSSVWLLATPVANDLELQSDGNLVLYDASGNPVWASGTTDGKTLTLQDDGNLVLTNDSGQTVWSSNSTGSATPAWYLQPSSILYRGQIIQSENKRYTLALQRDGNLVLYNKNGQARWSTNTTSGFLLAQQSDGNLVLYNKNGVPLWGSGTSGQGVTTYLQDDGNFVTYSQAGRALWSTGTVNW